MTDAPYFSIITINLNNAMGLQSTLDSVANQTFNDYQHVIVDGLSTDTSFDVIKGYKSSNIHFVSEKDDGIYDAMNKGIALAKGKYLLFLNSGDVLYEKSILSKVAAHIDNTSCYDCFYGAITFSDGTFFTPPPHLSLSHLYRSYIPHSGSFISAEVFSRLGGYDSKLKIVSDWKFFLEAFVKGYSFCFLNEIVACNEVGGISDNRDFQKRHISEREVVIKDLLKNIEPLLIENENLRRELAELNRWFLLKLIIDYLNRLRTTLQRVARRLRKLF